MTFPFRKSFKQNSIDEVVASKEILELLNDKLPKGYRYEALKNGFFAIVPTSNDESKKLMGVIKNLKPINVPEDLKAGNISQLMEYAYSTQTDIQLAPDSEVMIKAGKHEYPMIENPFTNQKINWEKIVLKPQKFREIHTFLFGDNEKRNIILKRVPARNTNEIKITNIKDTIFQFTLLFKKKENTVTVNVSINFHGKVKIEEILQCLKLQRCFFDRSIKLEDIALFPEKCGELSGSSYDIEQANQTIDWWEKVKKIEDALNTKFEISMPLTPDDEIKLKELYVGIVLHKPFKEYINDISDVTITFKERFQGEDMQGEMFFAFPGEESLSQFNSDKMIYKATSINAMRVIKIIPDKKNKNRVTFKLEKEDGKMPYIITKYTGSSEEAKDICNDAITCLKDAKLLKDYTM